MKPRPQPDSRDNDRPRAMNNGFWDRPVEERAARVDAACERYGVTNFFDLSPEERGTAYEDDR